jgi:phage-related protein
MASDLEIYDWLVTYGAKNTVTPDVLSAVFGDGYSQDIPDGINSTADSWSITSRLSPSDADDAFEFLRRQRGATRFWWTPPRYVSPIKVKTTGAIEKGEESAGFVTVTATFKQVFDPD